MNIDLTKSPKVGNSLLVVFTHSDKIKSLEIPFGEQIEINSSKDFLSEMKKSGEISGKKGEMTLLHSFLIENFTFNSKHISQKLHPKRLLFVGLGNSKNVNSEVLRESGANIAKKISSLSPSDFSRPPARRPARRAGPAARAKCLAGPTSARSRRH